MALKLLLLLALLNVAFSVPAPDPDPDIRIDVQQIVNVGGCCPEIEIEPSCVCVFGHTDYPLGAKIKDSCMELVCIEGDITGYGVWNYTGKIDKDCGECQLYGDPHIFTYDDHLGQDPAHYYPFMDPGNYIVTQAGLGIPADYGLSAYMEECYATETCVRGINYFEPGFEMNITLPNFSEDSGCYSSSSQTTMSPINDRCEPKIYVNGVHQPFDKAMESFSSTFGTVLLFPHNHYGIGDGPHSWKDHDTLCMNIVGSNGLSMSFCMSTVLFYSNLYVWTSPTLRGELYGLCDTYTNGVKDGYTMQNGSLTNNTDMFGSTWMTWQNEPSGNEIPNVDKCTNATVLVEIETICNDISEGVCGIIQPWQCEGFIWACVYDLCRSTDYNLQAQAYANHFLIQSHLAQ